MDLKKRLTKDEKIKYTKYLLKQIDTCVGYWLQKENPYLYRAMLIFLNRLK